MTTSQADINTNANSSTTTAGTAVIGGGGGGGVGGNTVTTNSGLEDSGGTTSLATKQSMTTMGNNSNNHGIQANSAVISDMGKRKKLKSRSSGIVPTSVGAGGLSVGYSKDHLDAWLETCLKDASTTQYSSSSEFLDYNPTSGGTGATTVNNSTSMTGNNLNYNNIFSPTPQQQQHQQQQQQQSVFNMANNINQSQQQQQQQQQNQQQQFAMRTSPMANNSLLNNNNSFNNFPFSQGFQRNNQMPNFMKPTPANSFAHRYNMMFSPISGGGGVGGGYYPQNDGSQDFASLPPMVNIMGGGSGGNSSEQENNSTDVLDGSANRGFRFSDPCLLNPSDNDSKLSGQNTPDRRANDSSDMDQNNKFFNVLMEQIQLLHETNTKICRDLHEAKVCIEVLKHAPNLGMRHRRDSISGLSTHSQPMVFGSGFGTHSPAPSFHSGAYTPGIMTDVVREVKDAARVREDALLNRVKALVEERQWSMNESNLRMMRDIEELKSQVHHLRLDRKETNKRLNHLEAENKYMRQMLAALYNNRTIPDIIYENETLRTRKSFPHSRRSQAPLNLHYGTIHHQTAASSSLDEQDEEPLHIVETPSTTSTADIAAIGSGQRPSADMRHSFSSSDGGSVNGSGVIGNSANLPHKVAPIMSPPNFALISSPCDDMKRKKEKATKKLSSEDLDTTDTTGGGGGGGGGGGNITSQDLRRELKEAVAARKDADDRIIALEKLVKTLQVNATHPPSSSMANSIIDNPTVSPTPPLPPSPQSHKTSQTTKHHAMSNGDGIGGGGGGGIGAHNHKSKLISSNTSSSSGGGPNKTINKRGGTTASTVASRSKWLSQQNQQHQHHQQQPQQQQHNHQQQQHQNSATTAVHNSPVKLSVAGPITDL